MAPRSSWKGYIKISLVSVPVKAYSATNSATTISLNQLHEPCHSRIKYQKVCPIHGEVPHSEIVSGYEYANGQYAVIDTAELEKLRTKGDKSIDVDQFAAKEEIDDRYLSGVCYYLVPDGPIGQKAYSLVRDVMVESQLNGVAKVVLSNKEQLVLLRPIENLIGMFVLRHAAELKAPNSFEDEVGSEKPSAQEMKLTKQLLEGLHDKKFDITQYVDEYTQKLTELIQAKVEGKELVRPEATDEPQVINLMEALKASVERMAPEAKAPKSKSPSKTARASKPTNKESSPRSSKKSNSTKTTSRKRKSG